MRKSPILLFAFLIAAVGASAPKERARLGYDHGVEATAHGGSLADSGTGHVSGYPPCSRTVTDRCIQLHERRVRAGLAQRARPAMGGPIEGSAAYPNCSRLITDECVQLFDRAARPARPAPVRRRAAVAQDQPETPGI